MQLFDVVNRRRSVRTYARSPVTSDQLEKIPNTVRLAPSADDLQAYRIVVGR